MRFFKILGPVAVITGILLIFSPDALPAYLIGGGLGLTVAGFLLDDDTENDCAQNNEVEKK